MTYNIRVTKKGINSGTATDPNDYIFHTDYNTFKVVDTGNGTVSVDATSSGYKYIAHNYGTTQGFITFFKYPGTNRVSYTCSPVADGSGSEDVSIWSQVPLYNNSGSIAFYAGNTSGTAKDIEYKYYLFEVPLE